MRIIEKSTCLALIVLILTVSAKQFPDFADFDDSVIYKIDFGYPDPVKEPQYANLDLITRKTVFTQDHEKYECLMPNIELEKDTKDKNEPELSPLNLIQFIFAQQSCSFRIEAYWSYEICHGYHVRQFHEEREGKNTKFQEFYLGKWSDDKTQKLAKSWEEERKAGTKYKTTRIDNIEYPYFEMEYSDGTMCDIINEPRLTLVRYICYPHGKNEIYSFKETSSCQYEAIILTSALCLSPAFQPEKTKEYAIKCYNSEIPANEPRNHKPLSLLKEEIEDDAVIQSLLQKKTKLLNDYNALLQASNEKTKTMIGSVVGVGSSTPVELPKITTKINDVTPLLEFISGKNCLTGGKGWWKYEFCYGRHVRQFHKEKKSEVELFLGYFSEQAHRDWAAVNPEKFAKREDGAASSSTVSIWHHYEKGTRCDRTGKPREVDVKLTCVSTANNGVALAMYLLEPKTCQYILVVESAIICDLIKLADEYGLVKSEKLEGLLQQKSLQNEESGVNDAPKSSLNSNQNSGENVQPIVQIIDINAL